MKLLTATRILRLLLLATAGFASGCAAFRPIDGVPARYLAPELRAQSRSNESTIDLSLLAQKPPRQHLVDAQDVLGIFIEGVLGNVGEALPVNNPTTPDIAPSIGYPMTVRDDGTLSLPMIGSVNVRGMTIRQVEERLRQIYTTERKILKKDADTIIVSLQRPREMRVLVLRQETGGPGGTQFSQGLSVNLGQTKRGNGQVVHLPVYKNDVLHALAQTGGLPGLDAENTIYVIRREHLDPASSRPTGAPSFAPTPAIPQPQPPQLPPSAGNQFSSVNHNNPANPNMHLVGYHRQANYPQINNGFVYGSGSSYSSPVEQVSAYNTTTPLPGTTPLPARANNNQFQSPVYSNGQQPVVPRYEQANRFTIEPVTASNFGNPDPLAELRAGMEPTGEEVVSEPLTLQREVTIEPASASNFQHSGETQPYLQQPYVEHPQWDNSFNGYGAPMNAPSMNAPAIPNGNTPMNAPVNNAWGNTPVTNFNMSSGSASAPSTDLEQFWSQVDLGIDNFDRDPTINNHKVIKIPIRLKPGEQPHIRPEDIILQDGDIVFIESRDTEIFYTGGLLGGGQFTLPRDYDLDVLGAISLAQGARQQQSIGNQIGGTSALNGDVTISASSVIILRRMPNGAQVPIKVDLYRALTDPSERVLIQPGDLVMLRYKPHEAIGAFIERNILSSALLGIAFTQFGGNGGN